MPKQVWHLLRRKMLDKLVIGRFPTENRFRPHLFETHTVGKDFKHRAFYQGAYCFLSLTSLQHTFWLAATAFCWVAVQEPPPKLRKTASKQTKKQHISTNVLLGLMGEEFVKINSLYVVSLIVPKNFFW